MTIWPLQAWQIPQMAQIERLCFSDPWSQKALEEELENPLALYFVACEGEQVLGYVGTRMVCGQCDVTNVAVHPRCRRQGRRVGCSADRSGHRTRNRRLPKRHCPPAP